jgi:uncharacterized protein YjiS (DUF1127 family)
MEDAMLKAAISWINEHRARRARYVALTELLAMDAHRLDDLGMSIADVMLAIEKERRPPRPAERPAEHFLAVKAGAAGEMVQAKI